MGKRIIDLIGNLVEITGNSYVDGVLIAIVGIISFVVAYNSVGKIFNTLGFYDSSIMSGVHWIIRTSVFCSLVLLLIKIVELAIWLLNIKWWIYLVAFCVMVILILCVYYVRCMIQKYQSI